MTDDDNLKDDIAHLKVHLDHAMNRSWPARQRLMNDMTGTHHVIDNILFLRSIKHNVEKLEEMMISSAKAKGYDPEDVAEILTMAEELMVQNETFILKDDTIKEEADDER